MESLYRSQNINNFKLSHITSQHYILFLNKYVKCIYLHSDQSSAQLCLKDQSDLFFVLIFLNKSTFFKFDLFTDLIVTDSQLKKRFLADYLINSTLNSNNLRLTCKVEEGRSLLSITSKFKASSWAEREAYDLFGLFFIGNPDLRRLLTDYGFKGHPLKKDYPLTGYYELSFKDSIKQINLTSIETTQVFNFKYSA